MKHIRFPILLVVPLLLLTACAPAETVAPTLLPSPAAAEAATPEASENLIPDEMNQREQEIAAEKPDYTLQEVIWADVSTSSEEAEAYIARHKGNKMEYIFREDDLLYNNQLFGLPGDFGRYKGLSIRPTGLMQITACLPNPCVREIGEDVYLIYRTDRDTQLYLFFPREPTHRMEAFGHPVVMSRKLAYADFAGLAVGINREEVAAIDPVTLLYAHFDDTVTDEAAKKAAEFWKVPSVFVSEHLLTDGMLRIWYERRDGAYLVQQVDWSEDFILDGINGATCYKILPEDYVEG